MSRLIQSINYRALKCKPINLLQIFIFFNKFKVRQGNMKKIK